jgi:hypothetical protein
MRSIRACWSEQFIYIHIHNLFPINFSSLVFSPYRRKLLNLVTWSQTPSKAISARLSKLATLSTSKEVTRFWLFSIFTISLMHLKIQYCAILYWDITIKYFYNPRSNKAIVYEPWSKLDILEIIFSCWENETYSTCKNTRLFTSEILSISIQYHVITTRGNRMIRN